MWSEEWLRLRLLPLLLGPEPVPVASPFWWRPSELDWLIELPLLLLLLELDEELDEDDDEEELLLLLLLLPLELLLIA